MASSPADAALGALLGVVAAAMFAVVVCATAFAACALVRARAYRRVRQDWQAWLARRGEAVPPPAWSDSDGVWSLERKDVS